MANVVTFTGVSRVSVGGDRLCYLAKASTSDNYATSGMTIAIGAGLGLGTVTEVVGLRGSVNAVANAWHVDPTSGLLIARILTAPGTEGANAAAALFADNETFLVFGRPG